MRLRILLPALAVVLGGALALGLLARRDTVPSGTAPTPNSPRREPAREAPDPPSPPAPAPQDRAEGDARAPLQPTATRPAVPPSNSEPQSARELAVQVFDLAGTPLQGVRVRALEGSPRGWTSPPSDADGRTLVRLAPGTTTELRVDDLDGEASPTWATLRAPIVRANRPAGAPPPFLLLVPGVRVGGVVLRPDGTPVPFASLETRMEDWWDEPSLDSFPFPLDETVWVWPSAKTDESGRFQLPPLPLWERGTNIRATGPDGSFALVSAPSIDTTDLRIVLGDGAPPAPDEVAPHLAGQVLLPDGSAAAGAAVSWGDGRTLTDSQGRFLVPLDDIGEENDLLAAGLSGYGPALLEDLQRLVKLARAGPVAPLTLVLTGDAVLRGRVLGPAGEPREGWRVSVRDGTLLADNTSPPLTVESLGGGDSTSTDRDGAFRLTGLVPDRRYRVRAYDPDSLRAVEETAPAGTIDLVLAERPEDTLAELRGRTVALDGTPLPGVEIRVQRVLEQTSHVSSWISGDETRSDADGRFVLHDVPAFGVHLVVSGAGVLPATVPLVRDATEEGVVARPGVELRLPVEARCHLRVTLTRGPFAGRMVRVLDAEGMPLPLFQFSASGSVQRNEWGFDDSGHTPMLAVSERARTLQVLHGTTVVQETQLFLHPGTPTEVEL